MMSPEPKQSALSFIVGVYMDTWHTLATHWRALLTAVAIPVSTQCLMLLGSINHNTSLTGWSAILAAVTFLIPSLFAAVACHRVTLLGPDSLTNRWGISVTAQHLRYLLWIILGTISIALSVIAFLLLVYFIRSWPITDWIPVMQPGHWVTTAVFWACCAAGIYGVTRLTLVLPAAAAGHRLGPEAVWVLSENRGWALMLATWLPALSVSFSLAPIQWLIGDHPSPWLQLPLFALVTLGGFASVVALSCAYRRLLDLDAAEDDDSALSDSTTGAAVEYAG